MPDVGRENGVRLRAGWPLVYAVSVGECDHCPGIVWQRADKAFMCLGCGCLRTSKGRESLCGERRSTYR